MVSAQQEAGALFKKYFKKNEGGKKKKISETVAKRRLLCGIVSPDGPSLNLQRPPLW